MNCKNYKNIFKCAKCFCSKFQILFSAPTQTLPQNTQPTSTPPVAPTTPTVGEQFRHIGQPSGPTC